MSFSIGQQVGQYRIESRIGQGGMATVYKAHHASLDRHVAIKVMHIALSEDPAFLERFRREAQIVGRLSHPHIIPIYDFSTYENQPYLVMKYVEGETLKQRMRRQPLTLEEVTDILDAVASALDFAHQNDVLHRDVKPSNIMLDMKGVPYLTDFGLARVASLGESTLSADVMLGTPQYISPEQARGVRQLDAGTDIYSLGVVLYELVVGRVPFTSDTPYTIIHDHIYKPLPLPTYVNPGVPHSVEQVLVKVLSKERLQRYNTAGDLAAAFRHAVGQSNMIEISLRTLRPEAFEDPQASGTPSIQVNTTPQPQPQPVAAQQMPAIPSPMMPPMTPSMTPSGNVLVPGSSVNYRVDSASGNGWVITGCLLFIVTCLVSAGVLLNALNDDRFQQEWEESRAQIEESTEISFDDVATDQLTADVLLQNAEANTLKQEQVDFYNDVYPNDVGGQLAEAYLLLQAERTPEALQQVGVAVMNPNPDHELMLNWADLMVSDGYDEPGLILYTAVYIAAFDDAAIRNEAGEYLYNQVTGLRGPTMSTVCSIFVQIPQFIQTQQSPQLYMITAQALISTTSAPPVRDPQQEQDEICPDVELGTADELIARGLESNPNMAELYFVQGNYYESIQEFDQAMESWQQALSYEDVPVWVVNKVETKLDAVELNVENSEQE